MVKLKFFQEESGGLGTSSVVQGWDLASVWHLLCRCHLGLECYAKKKRFEFEEGQGPLKNIIIILIIIEMSPLEELVVPYIVL